MWFFLPWCVIWDRTSLLAFHSTNILQNFFLDYTAVSADGLFVQDPSGCAFICADKMFLFMLFWFLTLFMLPDSVLSAKLFSLIIISMSSSLNVAEVPYSVTIGAHPTIELLSRF
jgi:hypothetical protein